MSWIFIKLAWRNLFRNKRRTLIAGIAIGIGLASLIFVDALWIGMQQNMIKTATASFLGDGQIHQQGFRDTQAVEKTINALDKVVSSLKQEGIVEHFTLRTLAFGMITSPANVNAINLVGVHPPTEKYLSQIDDAMTAGAYFEGDNARDIVIGNKLAEILEVGIGDRVVVTVAQSRSGDLSQEMFRISGIYHVADPEMNSGMAFVRLEKAQQMLALGDSVHEIAIQFTDTKYGQDKGLPFWEKYSQDGNEAIGWTVILPQLEGIFEMSKFSKYIMGIVLFGVVVFGIINTLFMSLYERMFEFGVLRAVGTRPLGMARLILFEAGALAILSIWLGVILGFVVTYLFTKIGLDYTGIEFAGVTLQELIYPVMTIQPFILYPIWVFVFTIITGLYPARYAAKMSPAVAMRRSF
jgi:ABC-type lipoprotein release transport system permease subunit